MDPWFHLNQKKTTVQNRFRVKLRQSAYLHPKEKPRYVLSSRSPGRRMDGKSAAVIWWFWWLGSRGGEKPAGFHARRVPTMAPGLVIWLQRWLDTCWFPCWLSSHYETRYIVLIEEMVRHLVSMLGRPHDGLRSSGLIAREHLFTARV